MFGYRRDDTIGKELAALIIPESLREAHRSALRRIGEGADPRLLGQRLELTGDTRGRRASSRSSSRSRRPSPRDSHGTLFTGFVRDITARKEIERERATLLVRERDSRRYAETAQQQTEFIAEVGTVLDTALDYERALAGARPHRGAATGRLVRDRRARGGRLDRALRGGTCGPGPARPDRRAARRVSR